MLCRYKRQGVAVTCAWLGLGISTRLFVTQTSVRVTKALQYFETSVNISQPHGDKILEFLNLHHYRWENLRSGIILFVIYRHITTHAVHVKRSPSGSPGGQTTSTELCSVTGTADLECSRT